MKKVKLFTTIASLCLAVALMAFGVYAAGNLELTVSGSVNFEATAVDGKWTWEATITGREFATGKEGDKTKTSTMSDLTFDLTGETPADFTIVITATFTTTAASSRGANLTLTNTLTGEAGAMATTLTTASATAGAKGENPGSLVATVKYTAGDALTDHAGAFQVLFSAVVGA